jgi:type IV pilus assembly protein PilM
MLKGNFDIPLDFLRSGMPPLVGVDISASAIKVVELNELPKKGGHVVERYIIEPLPRDAVVDGNIANLDVVGAALKQAIQRMGTRVRNACLALPAAAVITKKILLPAGLNETDLGYQAEAEANQYIPFAMDEVNLDFQVIGPAPGTNTEDVEVLLAASRKANVEDRVAAAAAAGLKAIVVDMETYAAEAALSHICAQLPDGAVDRNVVLVDLGANIMNVNVVRNGMSVYLRDQQIGGDQLTQQIQNVYGMSPEEAEHGKRYGGLPDNYESEILAPFRENVASEVARAVQFFFTATKFSEVDYIVLSGGSAALAGLDDSVATRAQVSTMVANPFAHMTLSSHVKPRQLQTDAPALMVACGLAMRRFDPT